MERPVAIHRKELERQQRRELLLTAAERVFGRKPFDEATMQEVAAEAQIGMQGLYEHFPSKQALYENLIIVRVQRFQKRIAEALEGVTEPLERLRTVARVQTESFADGPAFFAVFLREQIHFEWGFTSRFGPTLHRVYREEQKRLREIIESCVGAGVLQPQATDFLVQACLGAWEASLHYYFRHSKDEEIESCVNRAIDTFLSGVGVRP
jgi:TetR/AcrR family transcriptional regulator